MEVYDNWICGWCWVENLKKIQIGKSAQINVNGKIKCSKYSSKRQRIGIKMKEKLRHGTQSKKVQNAANKDYINKSEVEWRRDNSQRHIGREFSIMKNH